MPSSNGKSVCVVSLAQDVEAPGFVSGSAGSSIRESSSGSKFPSGSGLNPPRSGRLNQDSSSTLASGSLATSPSRDCAFLVPRVDRRFRRGNEPSNPEYTYHQYDEG